MSDTDSLFSHTAERICPDCGSADIVALARVVTDSAGSRSEYRCRDCGNHFWLDFSLTVDIFWDEDDPPPTC